MSNNFWELTQQILQSGPDPLVTKPKLQEKLLQKPPFKFLHDVITAVQNKTGFAPGLFSEAEMAKDTLEKDGKLSYLTKVINVVGIVLQQNIPTDPRKVIAGQDPESTNLFLQMLGQAARLGSGADAVQMVLNGEQPPEPVTVQEGTGRTQSRQRSREQQPAGPPPQAAPPQPAFPQPAPPQPMEPPVQQSPQHQQPPVSAKHNQATSSSSSQLTKQRSKGRDSAPGEDNPTKARLERTSSKGEPTSTSPEKSRKAGTHEDSKTSRSKLTKQDSVSSNKVSDTGQSASSSRRNSNSSLQKPPSFARPEQNSRHQTEASSSIMAPTEQPPSPPVKPARLQSAGRAPPKRIDSKKLTPQTPAPGQVPPLQQTVGASAPAKPVAVLEEGAGDDTHDDVEVVVESVPSRSAASAAAPESQGILVKNIMEAEKNLKQQAGSDTKADDQQGDQQGTGIVLKRLGRSAAPTKTNDVAAIREMVQQLCTNTQPLAKCMEYLQEDLDSMTKEYRFWSTERRVFQEKLAEEQKLHQDMPTSQAQVADLDNQISQTRERVLSLKAQVLRNEDTIQKLITMVVSSTR